MIINQFNDHDSKDQVYPDNYQQFLNAFYPINRAKPSSVMIAYFTNYTDPLPEECSLGTYPWRTYPRIYTLLYATLRTVLYYYYNYYTTYNILIYNFSYHVHTIHDQF